MHFTNLPQFFLDTFSIINLENLKVARLISILSSRKRTGIQKHLYRMESVNGTWGTMVTNSQTKYRNETLT